MLIIEKELRREIIKMNGDRGEIRVETGLGKNRALDQEREDGEPGVRGGGVNE